MKLGIFLLIGALVLSVGCTSFQVKQLEIVNPDNRSEILVYRESALNAGGMGLIFGVNGDDYVKLRNDSYSFMYLKSGSYDLFVRSDQADQSYTLSVDLETGEKQCFRAYPNPSNIAKAIFLGLAYYMGNTFLLEKSECMTEDELKEYRSIAVQYKNT